MERLLHYVWKYKLYTPTELYTTDGLPITILDPGIHNPDAGPDFFNAKIKLGNTLWAGCVEIHCRSSDWFRHKHQQDQSYNTIILHVVGIHDQLICRTDGNPIPHLVLPVPEHVHRNIEWLLHRDTAIPCLTGIREIDPVFLSSWLAKLSNERLERKTTYIFSLLEQYEQDWNEIFYIVFTRNLGFGINSDAFEWLARNLPFRYLLKQRGSSSQIEAMLIGQAGLLTESHSCDYYKLLQKEYQFLKHKFNLKTNDNYFYKSLRTRPGNFPHVKLAQLAAILMQHDTLFSIILNTPDPEHLKSYFRIPPSLYWETHYHFKSASAKKEKILGEEAIRIILINTVIPLLFAYGKCMNLPEISVRAVCLLESLAPEKNHIITTFENAGVKICNASESQALIQLKREYCEKKKCLYCQIGFRLMKRTSPGK